MIPIAVIAADIGDDGETSRLWAAVGELAVLLPPRWVLIGGLMFQIHAPPTLGAGRRAIGVPGGSQALARSEEVTVRVAAGSFALRRPSLLGAILIKARLLMVHADPASQRQDLLMLLSLVEDPRTLAEQLKRSERAWLRAADARHDLDSPSTLNAPAARRARQAFRLLLQEA